MIKTLAPIVAAVAALSAIPCQAGEPIVAVAYGDLNLANPAGKARFDGRVKNAADRLCGPHGVANLREAAEAVDCRNAFTAEAKALVSTRFARRAGGDTLASR